MQSNASHAFCNYTWGIIQGLFLYPENLTAMFLIEFGAPGPVPGQAPPAGCIAVPMFCTNTAGSYLENGRFCASEESKEQCPSQATLSQTGQRLSCPKSSHAFWLIWCSCTTAVLQNHCFLLSAWASIHATKPHLWNSSQRGLQVTNRPWGQYLSLILPAEEWSPCLVSHNSSTGLTYSLLPPSLPALQGWMWPLTR